ncbi:MAG: reverse transcriptase domain-containing protein, partial [Bacteroides sp.]
MSTNNVYFVDMERRFNDFCDNKIDLRALHVMVYDTNNVALALRQLSKSDGRMAKGPDGTNFETLEPYAITELANIVKERLLTKKMSYVRRKYIPKGNSGKKRPLGICSIWDKLVEKCIQLVVEPYCETKFVDSSFGFREQVSTHNALAKVKNQCETMPFVLSVDLKNYFGTIDPDVAYRELWHIGMKDKIILNYIYRFIKKGYFEDSCKVEDPRGTPQGSILGPLISNVYLHRFDVWLREQGDCWHDPSVTKFHNYANKRRNVLATNLKLGIHVRYADDILVLCKTREHAERFRHSVTHYLVRNMRLEINTDKTKVYDLTCQSMKYLGYEFLATKRHSKNPQQNGKYRIRNSLPQAKADEIAEKCRVLLRA